MAVGHPFDARSTERQHSDRRWPAQSKLGGAEWSGKVALSEKRPPYELALSVKDLDIEKAADGTAIQGKLNLKQRSRAPDGLLPI